MAKNLKIHLNSGEEVVCIIIRKPDGNTRFVINDGFGTSSIVSKLKFWYDFFLQRSGSNSQE